MSCKTHRSPGFIRKAIAKAFGWGIHFTLGRDWQVLIISPCLAEYYRSRYKAAESAGLVDPADAAAVTGGGGDDAHHGQYL